MNISDGTDEREFASVSRLLRMQSYAAGELIGAGSDQVCLIRKGSVRLYTVSRGGQEVTTAVLVPGQLFGLSALVGVEAEPVLAQCLDECCVCEAGANDFLAILARHPQMMTRVVRSMARQICRLEETVQSLALESSRARLARHLLRLADAGATDPGGRLLPAETREEMARAITTSRETVSRALAAWTRQGVIITRGRRVVLRDADALARELPADSRTVSGARPDGG